MRTIAEAMAAKAAEEGTTKPASIETKPVEGEETTPADTPQPDQDDIVSRIAKYKEETPATNVDSEGQPNDTDPFTKFNVNDIDKIEDPNAKEYVQKAYKSFEKGYQQKFQQLAEERKQLEQQMSDLNKWTPEKVQSLLSNQEFINASQTIVASSNPTEGELSDDQWSALSATEKQEISSMKRELQQMKQQNQLSKFQAELDRQNAELANKYSDYNADVVNQLRNDMLQGKIQATNEHLWKVVNYEDAIKRAYKMGKDDRNLDTDAKREASSTLDISGSTSRNTGEVKKMEGESSKDFLMRRIRERMEEKHKK